MLSDPTVVAALIGLGGLVFAAILTSAGYLYRNRLEAKKSARQVLYLLLEMRYTLHATTFDPSEAAAKHIEHFVEHLTMRSVRITTDDVELSLQPMFTNHFANLVEAAKTDVKERLLQPFENALSDLANISPVLAYRMRGKEKLEAFAALTTAYTEQIQADMMTDLNEDGLQATMTRYMQDAKRRAIDEMKRQLDEDILMLAKHCGRRDFRGCKKVIAKKFGELDSQEAIELDRLFEELLTPIVELQKPATARTKA